MSAVSASRSKIRGVGGTSRFARLRSLCGDLQAWRANEDLKVLEAAKGSALVLPFVKGLRLSAQLIYILRGELSDTPLEVDWGHLLDDHDKSCSPECDVIIHHKGHAGEWNGSTQPVMHFKFVKKDHAVAVISCKSLTKSVDGEYAKKLRPYVKHVFLFAECCPPGKEASLRKKAKEAGYAGFGLLYTYDEKTGDISNNEKGWDKFLDAIASKVKRASKVK